MLLWLENAPQFDSAKIAPKKEFPEIIQLIDSIRTVDQSFINVTVHYKLDVILTIVSRRIIKTVVLMLHSGQCCRLEYCSLFIMINETRHRNAPSFTGKAL